MEKKTKGTNEIAGSINTSAKRQKAPIKPPITINFFRPYLIK